jgi:Zn-dependent protease with chaperone function
MSIPLFATTVPTSRQAPESDAAGVAPFHGVFLDGKTAAKLPATLAADGAGLVLQWAQSRRILGASDLLPMQPCCRGVQFVRLTDGGTCEIPASPELLTLLTQAGVAIQKDSAAAAVLHGDWRITAMALAFLAGVIAAFYVWLLPSVAEFGASLVPEQVQRRLGQTALRQVEAQWLSPSKLPSAQQGAIQSRFRLLTLNLVGPESRGLELLIRRSSEGPNAFALPGNYIVLTDELVTLVDGDLDAISGVLAHELGHLKHQHGLRSVVQATALTILGSTLIGDYSSALAIVPAALGHLNYSRHFETEADVYSRDVLCDLHIDPAKTALFFDRVTKIKGNAADLIPSYLSSHPGSEQRATYFRRPCPKP